jgi:hypothetical protein
MNDRNVYAMSNRSNVNTILPNSLAEIGNSNIIDPVLADTNDEEGTEEDFRHVFTLQCGLSDIITTSQF